MQKYIALLLSLAGGLLGQNPAWTEPYPAHTVAGNVHYVGTADLACFLIATPAGNVLVNSGLASSTPLIRASVEKLGFALKDVKILLTMQAHFDHVAAFAEIQKLSGASIYATGKDAPLLESGGKSDPYNGGRNAFAPVKVDRILKDGEVLTLGGTKIRVIFTPGHSPGSVSYEISTPGKPDVLLVNMQSVVMPLVGNKLEPNIVEAYRRGFAAQKKLKPTIWVAAHGSQYGMAEKHKKGSFADPEGYVKAVARYEAAFEEQLAKERPTGLYRRDAIQDKIARVLTREVVR
jgi:metallo-beta-lactamase class B